MGNQQITREEIGWLAGIIDGEGYLGMSTTYDKRRSQPNPNIVICLHVSNTDEEIVLKSQGILRKLGVNPYIRATKANAQIKKDQYRVQIKHMAKLKKILLPLLPHLTGNKQERARLVLEFIELRKQDKYVWVAPNNDSNRSGPIKPYTDRELEIFKLCSSLQKRGISETQRGAQRQTSEIWQLMKSREAARQLEVAKV